MEKFAKIIEVSDCQVLIRKTIVENDIPSIKISTQFKFVQPEITITFRSDKSRDEAFNEYDEEGAAGFVLEMRNLFV